MSRTVVIAALERELRPFVHAWARVSLIENGRSFRGYVSNDVVAVASGVGLEPARVAARAAISRYKPATLISVGLAGALVPNLKVGDLLTPNVVFNGATGAEFRCDGGSGVLVSADAIAGSESKRRLAERFHACGVDMEAAAVAEVARQERIGFSCVKAISDEAEFRMPPMNEFVDAEGNFHTGRFVAWTAVHPQYWGSTMLLARNSRRAIQVLCEWLKQNVGNPESQVIGRTTA